MFERADYEALLKENRAKPQELRLLQQSEVSADLLTKDSHWDVYLQLLQTQIEKAESSKQAFAAILLDYATVDPQHREYVHRLYIQAQERVASLLYAQSLPKQIISEVKNIIGLQEIKLDS